MKVELTDTPSTSKSVIAVFCLFNFFCASKSDRTASLDGETRPSSPICNSNLTLSFDPVRVTLSGPPWNSSRAREDFVWTNAKYLLIAGPVPSFNVPPWAYAFDRILACVAVGAKMNSPVVC